MKLFAAVVIGLFLSGPAWAQDVAPAPALAPAPAPNPDQNSDQAVLEQCRAAVAAKNLDEQTKHKELAACIIAATPKIAQRIRCLMDPRLKTMDKPTREVAIVGCLEGKPIP
ncbi:MAG: hypothetical protein ABSC72_07260 [Methylovirgula sp.]|jgi:hypothetical protein